FPAGSMAGNGPEGRVVDRRGVWWTGRASGGQEMNRRGIIGPESVAAASGQLGNSWNAKSAKRGLSACSVEGPLTTSSRNSAGTLAVASDGRVTMVTGAGMTRGAAEGR